MLLTRRLLTLANGARTLDSQRTQIRAVLAASGLVDDLAVVAAGGGLGAEGRGLDAGGGLIGFAGLFGEEGDAAVGAGHDADGFVLDVAVLLLVEWSVSSLYLLLV